MEGEIRMVKGRGDEMISKDITDRDVHYVFDASMTRIKANNFRSTDDRMHRLQRNYSVKHLKYQLMKRSSRRSVHVVICVQFNRFYHKI